MGVFYLEYKDRILAIAKKYPKVRWRIEPRIDQRAIHTKEVNMIVLYRNPKIEGNLNDFWIEMLEVLYGVKHDSTQKM